MSIEVEIEPDPSRPLGGYARILLPIGTLSETTTTVSVYEMFRERFLGKDGWQATEAAFGPYEVKDTGSHQEVLVGPEIVNHLAEFAPIRLAFGSVLSEATWPDSVAQAPNAPPIGHIFGGESGAQETGPKQAVKEPDPTPEPPEPAPAPPKHEPPSPIPEPPKPEPQPNPPGPNSGLEPKAGFPWLAVALVVSVLILAGAGAYYYFVLGPEPGPVTETSDPPDPVEEEPETAATDTCSEDVLMAVEGSFSEQLSSLRACGADASADTALVVLEAGVDAEDPEALLIFGHLYNPSVTDGEIEEVMGLSFSDLPEVAIDYYIRARDAGATDAEDALQAACESLRAADPGAAEDLCE